MQRQIGSSLYERLAFSRDKAGILRLAEHLMLELGKGFLFERRQRRISLGGDHFWVDLTFYNRLLKCGEFADIDHLISLQTDHRFRGKLTT